MVRKVRVYVNVMGEIVEKEIVMDDSGKMTPSDPSSRALNVIMTDPIYVKDEVLSPEKDPYKFFENLYIQYSGSLVRVSMVEEI